MIRRVKYKVNNIVDIIWIPFQREYRAAPDWNSISHTQREKEREKERHIKSFAHI